MESLDDIVGFKNRKIYQNRDFFCYSLDSLLLSYYVDIKKNDKNVLELGVGNGVNLLILSKRYQQKMIGIDIRKENIVLAQKSIEYNHLDDQLKVMELNIKDCYKKLGNDKYDVILCNPPYYSASTNKDTIKGIAKSEKEITLDEIFNEVKKLLKNSGRFYLVYPTTNLENIITLTKKYNLNVKNIRYVYYDEAKSSKVMLLKICKNSKTGLIVEKPLILFKNGKKTREYKEMLGEI